MSAICYIENNPQFTIDFKQFSSSTQNREEEDRKTRALALEIFHVISVIPTCIAKASWVTLSYAGTSFKHIVLGFYGSWHQFDPPADIYLAVFKVAFWALGLAWCITTTAFRLLMEELFPVTPKFLADYAMEGINVNHLQTNEMAIDISHVEADVKIDHLTDIYEAINFDRKDDPGYMPPSIRQEGKEKVHSVQDLKESLKTFIKRVKNREAFLGTPPAYDTPRLMAFYQQIENAVLFSIDASNKRIVDFQLIHGEDISQYDESLMKTYKGLLEDRARIAIDLAVAGVHCGARYLGEAMSVYENMKGDAFAHKGSLEDCIIELLARRRYKIAVGQIQTHFGNSTHSYNKYMANLGKMLALPGTENIIEHLDTHFERNKFLKYFFKEYTVDVIIDAIQNEFKKSQLFREKVIDWVKDQCGDWKREHCQENFVQLISNILDVMNQPFESENHEWTLFHDLIKHLKKNRIELPQQWGNWNELIETVFNLPEVKKWRDIKFPRDHVLNILKDQGIDTSANQTMNILVFQRQQVERLKKRCLLLAPTNEDLIHLKSAGREELLNDLLQRFKRSFTIERIRQIIALENETVIRIMRQPEEERRRLVEEVVVARKDLERRSEFWDQIAQRHVLEKELLEEKREFEMTSEIMEWITVSQGIFTAQEIGEEV